MGLTTSGFRPESPSPPLARHARCHGGSRRKYKPYCHEHDERLRRQLRPVVLPAWLLDSRSKLHQFEKYACQVFDLPALLASQSDSRRAPEIPTADVVNSLFHSAVLRIPSLNALEGDLKESDFQKLMGFLPTLEQKPFSADVVANVLDKLHLPGLQGAIQQVIEKAERNKVFREGSYGSLRCVAIDGWEPFASYDRHCSHCLVRRVKKKNAAGETEEVEQYYHCYVVALLLGPVVDVVLGIEAVRNEEVRADSEHEHAGHEGELTAAHRLLDFLHKTYGRFIDAIVSDALYANGTWMGKLDDYGYGGFIVLKKENNEPLKEALALMQHKPPCEVYDDPESKEHIEFCDEDHIDTLITYQGKVRVIRAVVTRPDQDPTTWCLAIVGERARRISRRTALKIIRSRWHIENTGFNQWIQHWKLGHVYRHSHNAILAVLLIWMLAFNVLQLFIYRRLKRPRRPKDPTNTIRHIVETMLREIATLPEPLPWRVLWDSS